MSVVAKLAQRKHQRTILRAKLRLHRLDLGLSYDRLRDRIWDATGVRVSTPTLMRFLADEYATSELNVHAIQRYLASFRRVQL